jgi:hypothetical protein
MNLDIIQFYARSCKLFVQFLELLTKYQHIEVFCLD